MNSTFFHDGFQDALKGAPLSPPASPWPDHEAAIGAEYRKGYETGGTVVHTMWVAGIREYELENGMILTDEDFQSRRV